MTSDFAPADEAAQPASAEASADASAVALRRRMEGLLGVPATEANALTLLRNGDRIFPAMLQAIAAAERTVDFMTFVYWRGDIAVEFADALAAAARRGVRVRVLIDALGGRLMDAALIDRMANGGAHVEWFRPIHRISLIKQNHRGHRKVLICDERVAFTGGVGIAEEWCGDARNEREWRDTHVRLEGPAVDGLRAAFAQNWAETGCPIVDDVDAFPEHQPVGDAVVQVVRGSGSVGWSDMSTLFATALDSAQRQVRITTAYFAPDAEMIDRLCALAGRGVEVDVLLPGPHADKRLCQLASEFEYATLCAAGVRVWNFQPSMLHAKIMTVDGVLAVIGSSNFNRRSMSHDEEVVLTVFDQAVGEQLDRDFTADLQRSERIRPERWQRRSARQRLLETASRPVRRWL